MAHAIQALSSRARSSCPALPDRLELLVRLPVDWYVLQGDPGLADRPAGFGTVAGKRDLVELARVMRGLDLVVTIDSMTAHLAGALAVPVWTLLHAGCDWRWMIDRDDSPWYPTMRLFRQEQGRGRGSSLEWLRSWRVSRAATVPRRFGAGACRDSAVQRFRVLLSRMTGYA